MINVCIINPERKQLITELTSELKNAGFFCSSCPTYNDDTVAKVLGNNTDAVLISIDSRYANQGWTLAHTIKEENEIPVIPLLTLESLDGIDSDLKLDDFVLEPWNGPEVVARLQRVLTKADRKHSDNVIRYADLLIDLDSCEVWVDDKLMSLTYKEYELLKFLIGSPGRVFDRDTILNKVWGHDYFGGDRTVDVHIRRLRSKIEDSRHTFIDTIRNIGYRFKKDL
ncbi:MAG: response regulator transcription factor [Chloroflexi bacterium]|jgi:two-component system, OmpR family, alkaline phosphatase synthesis response regulator PhoP|nr:response regulator transcription factor [Chloroflexota bacterium]MBT7080261.1 response regulator transcription factor [Chloroflexota bacterium]MBT7289341.1 response regulator transcription factor [Chloroflexota bacterium]